MAQRMHGGAALQHIPLATPGFQGLNTESAASLLGPEWATELKNCVIDDANRLAARKGWSDQTTTPAAAAFVSGFEYETHAGTKQLLMATATTIERSTDGGASWTAVTGTASFTNGNWQFLNFADKVVGFQYNKAPIVYSGTTFSHISDSGNEPNGGCATVFGGRIYACDADSAVVKYCALLDETDWSSADAGYFDFTNVWKGTDTVQALAIHNGALVVFGKRNIIFLVDGAGAKLGLNPTDAYVVDVISGVGCAARDSVQNVDGDLWFVSDSGLMSLGRLVQERSNPMENIGKNVRSALVADLTSPTFDTADLRAVYSPKDRFYLLSLPEVSGSSEVGTTWVFDTRGRLQDGTVRCLGQWTGLIPTVLLRRSNDDILSANYANTGELFLYDGQNDDTATYPFVYKSGWTDLGAPGVVKILKRFAGVFFSSTASTVTYKWAFDFSQLFDTRAQSFSGGSTAGAWDEALWDTSLWGGGTQLREGKIQPAGTGKYIKWGLDVTIDGQEFSVQQLELFAKLGRMG